MPSEQSETEKGEIAADCPYINEYCRTKHRSVVRCSWTSQKGRILTSEKAFAQGDIIFREPPLHIVAEDKRNTAFEKLRDLCKNRPKVFEYEALWYWCALSSLTHSQLSETDLRLKPITDDQQRKLLLLYHSEVKEASEAVKVLIKELDLERCKPLDLERVLQIWILNCFEHSDDPLGYSTYFMSSFMSHSCLPNAVWHYDGDDFVLRARCDISDHAEISVSYLSEDALLESVPSRRKHLKDSKHFVCTCVRCSADIDSSRAFRCPLCPGSIFFSPNLAEARANASEAADVALELQGVPCSQCGHMLTELESRNCIQEERTLESKLDACERRMERNGRSKHSTLMPALEEALSRAELVLAQHWMMEKTFQLLADIYDRNDRATDAEAMMRKRIAFQKGAFPHLSGTRAWTLEAYVDMILRHNGAKVDPLKIPGEGPARTIASLAPQVYAESLAILRLMFGEEHEHFTSVNNKSTDLDCELTRILGSGAIAALVGTAE